MRRKQNKHVPKASRHCRCRFSKLPREWPLLTKEKFVASKYWQTWHDRWLLSWQAVANTTSSAEGVLPLEYNNPVSTILLLILSTVLSILYTYINDSTCTTTGISASKNGGYRLSQTFHTGAIDPSTPGATTQFHCRGLTPTPSRQTEEPWTIARPPNTISAIIVRVLPIQMCP